MEEATLMMVTYNRLELTKKTLNYLFKNDPGVDYNLVIVDNGSSDGTVGFLDDIKCNERLKKIIIVKLPENKGIAIGRNIALKEANKLNTIWYSTIDNDVLLPKNWLYNCIEVLRKNPTYGMMGVNFESQSFPIVKLNGDFEIQNKPRGNLGTACTVFHKRFHQMLGFFNTEYGLYGEEDADMGMRARAVGFKLGYIKENGVHLGEGEQDVGEYRKFKTKCHQNNLSQFNKNARAYFSKQKQFYIPFKE